MATAASAQRVLASLHAGSLAELSEAGSGFLVLGALAYMAWGPSFTGSALKGCRPEGAVVRMAGSKWVNEDDPEMSHPSGLYVLPLKPAKKTESYTYTWKKNEKGELEEYAGYVKVPFKGDERAAAYYTQRKGNGCWDHWGKSGEGNTGTDFNYLEFFKEEIRNENATIKIGAVNNLHLIASALGPNRTVAELIPYVVQVWSDAKKLELLVTLPRKGVSPFFMWLLNLHPALRTYVFNTYVGYAEISADRWCKRQYAVLSDYINGHDDLS
ncbi:hypothetical protein AK812_SmicGene42261 [Symbiodinium microadriaticum]|uniref:Uncharacterized protein n=1 Tax=Symbiodinium microadriaticum TaxID=2951 RepID=A0A1Q9C412_SYMMI|nr:hypothetical protein AK812_SmicGene42261 [Symbiodinium microadriaticum]